MANASDPNFLSDAVCSFDPAEMPPVDGGFTATRGMGRRVGPDVGRYEERVSPFRELPEHELARLSDEEQVEYMLAARTAGRLGAAVNAARILAFRHQDRISAFIRSKIGDMGDLVCDEVIERSLTSAIDSAHTIEGSTIKEFRAFIFQIARRRLADFFRERERRVKEVPMERRVGDETAEWDFAEGDTIAAIDDASVFQQAYDALSERHRFVIVCLRFRDLSQAEVAAEVNRQFDDDSDDPMTEQNVAKINSRFTKEIRRLLEEADDPADPDEDDDDD